MINVSVEIRIFFGFKDRVDYRQFADFFCLEVVRIIKHFAVAVTENVGREPAVHTQHTGLEHRSQYGFHQCLTALEVFSCDRYILLLGEFPHSRSVYTQVRSTHYERSAFCDSSVCIAHTRRDHFCVVVLHRFFQSSEWHVFVWQRNVDFSTCSPKYHNAFTVIGSLEVADVLTQLLYHFPTGSSFLDVRTVQTFCPIVVESSRHRLDSFQFVFHSVQVLFFQNLSVHSSFVCIIRENVPTSENNVVQIRQGHNVLDEFFFVVFHAHCG